MSPELIKFINNIIEKINNIEKSNIFSLGLIFLRIILLLEE